MQLPRTNLAMPDPKLFNVSMETGMGVWGWQPALNTSNPPNPASPSLSASLGAPNLTTLWHGSDSLWDPRPGSPTAARNRLQSSQEWQGAVQKGCELFVLARTCYFLLQRKKNPNPTITCAAPRAEPHQRDASANGPACPGHVHTQR